MELDADHRIVSIWLFGSLRTTKGKPLSRPKFDWKKLQVTSVRDDFQLQLSSRFYALQFNDTSVPIFQWYQQFKLAVSEVAEEVVGKCKPCGMPSFVTDKTIKLKLERDGGKRRYMISKSKQSQERWWRLNSSLKDSYKADETAMLKKEIEDL